MDPMTIIAVVGLVASVAGGVSGGMGQQAAAEQANQQAIQRWQQEQMQRGINNGKSTFEAAYKWQQQVKRNQLIREGAWKNREEGLKFVGEQALDEQTNLSLALRQQDAINTNAMGVRGYGLKGSMSNALNMASGLQALRSAGRIQKNLETARLNIEKQTNQALMQETSNIFIPDMVGTDAAPILGNTSAPLTASVLGGVAQGIGTFASVYGAAGS